MRRLKLVYSAYACAVILIAGDLIRGYSPYAQEAITTDKDMSADLTRIPNMVESFFGQSAVDVKKAGLLFNVKTGEFKLADIPRPISPININLIEKNPEVNPHLYQVVEKRLGITFITNLPNNGRTYTEDEREDFQRMTMFLMKGRMPDSELEKINCDPATTMPVEVVSLCCKRDGKTTWLVGIVFPKTNTDTQGAVLLPTSFTSKDGTPIRVEGNISKAMIGTTKRFDFNIPGAFGNVSNE